MPIDSSVNGLPFGAITCGARLHAAARQRDVGGDHDVAGARALGDPVVGGVGPAPAATRSISGSLRHADEAVGDDGDRQPVARRDAIDLVLHRTGVGIDIDADGGLPRDTPFASRWPQGAKGERIGIAPPYKFSRSALSSTENRATSRAARAGSVGLEFRRQPSFFRGAGRGVADRAIGIEVGCDPAERMRADRPQMRGTAVRCRRRGRETASRSTDTAGSWWPPTRSRSSTSSTWPRYRRHSALPRSTPTETAGSARRARVVGGGAVCRDRADPAADRR